MSNYKHSYWNSIFKYIFDFVFLVFKFCFVFLVFHFVVFLVFLFVIISSFVIYLFYFFYFLFFFKQNLLLTFLVFKCFCGFYTAVSSSRLPFHCILWYLVNLFFFVEHQISLLLHHLIALYDFLHESTKNLGLFHSINFHKYHSTIIKNFLIRF